MLGVDCTEAGGLRSPAAGSERMLWPLAADKERKGKPSDHSPPTPSYFLPGFPRFAAHQSEQNKESLSGRGWKLPAPLRKAPPLPKEKLI